jgi:DNA-binding XRE family transcriptional regulator
MPCRRSRLPKYPPQTWLLAFRQERDVSQLQAGKLVRCSQTEWCCIERGLKLPAITLAKRISRLTKIPVDVLMHRVQQRVA